MLQLIGNTYKGEPVRSEIFYNYSGVNAGSGATHLQDIAEVFRQRSAEIDSSGELGKRFEYFWDNLVGDHSLTQKLKTILPSAALILDQLYSAMMNQIVAGWSYILSITQHNVRVLTPWLPRDKNYYW